MANLEVEIYGKRHKLRRPGGRRIGFRFRIRAGNGEPIASGQEYDDPSDAVHAVELMADGLADALREWRLNGGVTRIGG